MANIDERLKTIIEEEAERQKSERKETKLIALGFAVAAAVYFGLAFYWKVEITHPIDTGIGMAQRAAAFEKAVDYDDSMSTRVRRGGWMKSFFMWPASTNDAEMDAAVEFAGAVADVRKALAEEGIEMCDAALAAYEDAKEPLIENDTETKSVIALGMFATKDDRLMDIGMSPHSGYWLLAQAFIDQKECI